MKEYASFNNCLKLNKMCIPWKVNEAVIITPGYCILLWFGTSCYKLKWQQKSSLLELKALRPFELNALNLYGQAYGKRVSLDELLLSWYVRLGSPLQRWNLKADLFRLDNRPRSCKGWLHCNKQNCQPCKRRQEVEHQDQAVSKFSR